MQKDKFVLDDNSNWYCNQCQSKRVKDTEHQPATEQIFQEQYDENCDDLIEKEVTVATEIYLDLECLNCGNKHFESLQGGCMANYNPTNLSRMAVLKCTQCSKTGSEVEAMIAGGDDICLCRACAKNSTDPKIIAFLKAEKLT